MRDLVLTETARLTLQKIFDFIEDRWNEKVADDFLFKVESTLITVCKSPEIFKFSQTLNARKGFVTKQKSFIYIVNATTITILYFWDNRQEPIE